MDRLIEDLIKLVFMHSVNTWLFIYITVKLCAVNISLKKMIYITFCISILSFGLREILIFANLSQGIFVFINLAFFIITMAMFLKLNFRYTMFGTLVSFAAMVVFSPIAYLSVKEIGWEYPNESVFINILCGYFEMLGLFVLALYLKLTQKNIRKVISIK